MTVGTEQEIEMMNIDEAEGLFGPNITIDGNRTAENATSVDRFPEWPGHEILMLCSFMTMINLSVFMGVYDGYKKKTTGQRNLIVLLNLGLSVTFTVIQLLVTICIIFRRFLGPYRRRDALMNFILIFFGVYTLPGLSAAATLTRLVLIIQFAQVHNRNPREAFQIAVVCSCGASVLLMMYNVLHLEISRPDLVDSTMLGWFQGVAPNHDIDATLVMAAIYGGAAWIFSVGVHLYVEFENYRRRARGVMRTVGPVDKFENNNRNITNLLGVGITGAVAWVFIYMYWKVIINRKPIDSLMWLDFAMVVLHISTNSTELLQPCLAAFASCCSCVQGLFKQRSSRTVTPSGGMEMDELNLDNIASANDEQGQNRANVQANPHGEPDETLEVSVGCREDGEFDLSGARYVLPDDADPKKYWEYSPNAITVHAAESDDDEPEPIDGATASEPKVQLEPAGCRVAWAAKDPEVVKPPLCRAKPLSADQSDPVESFDKGGATPDEVASICSNEEEPPTSSISEVESSIETARRGGRLARPQSLALRGVQDKNMLSNSANGVQNGTNGVQNGTNGVQNGTSDAKKIAEKATEESTDSPDGKSEEEVDDLQVESEVDDGLKAEEKRSPGTRL